MRSTLCAAAQGGLPLYQSLIGNLYFSTCFKAALHLVLSHTNKWIRPGTRQNLPLTRRWARKTGALGPEYFKSSTATSNEQIFFISSAIAFPMGLYCASRFQLVKPHPATSTRLLDFVEPMKAKHGMDAG